MPVLYDGIREPVPEIPPARFDFVATAINAFIRYNELGENVAVNYFDISLDTADIGAHMEPLIPRQYSRGLHQLFELDRSD
jgi:hypothetical protein